MSDKLNPIIKFKEWFDLATEKEINDPNAMCLSTVDDKNTPHSRMVLLKDYNDEGFIFYTNYMSNKGKSMSNNSNVCLSFFWPSHERQVIIKGKCIFMSKKESDKYFYSRPIDSQIGAIASDQSSEIPNRKYIVDKFDDLKKNHKKITRPEHWGGVIVHHETIEFWQGRKNRLHDRIFFTKSAKGKWSYSRLSP